jgi:hypothetical protein
MSFVPDVARLTETTYVMRHRPPFTELADRFIDNPDIETMFFFWHITWMIYRDGVFGKEASWGN